MTNLTGRKNYDDKKKKAVDKYLGKYCFFCNSEKLLVCHRKDGKLHKRFQAMGHSELEKHLKSNKYVRLCRTCHSGTHWCMKVLGLSWSKITKAAL